MKRINYFVSLIMVLAVILFASITGVSAASSLPSSVTSDSLREVEYIKNFPVIVKTADNGKYYVYCMNITATYASGVKFSVKGSVADGYLYILNHRPNTGNKDKDFYITQMAVWYYEDYLNQNNNNLEKVVKQYILSHKDSEEVSKKIYNLYVGARDYKASVGTLSITKPSSLTWTKADGYYVSPDIKINSSNLSGSITYGLSNAPVGTKIVKGSAANTIVVKVPVDKIPEGSKLTLTLKVSGNYNKQTAYYYYNSSKYQKLLFQDPKDQSVALSDAYDMTIIPEKKYEVSFSKVDATTGGELSGATLAIYQSNTKLDEWVSNGSVHKFSLLPGTYTYKELKAPAKYVLNSTPVTFVVDAAGNVTVSGSKVSKVVLKNTKVCYKAEFVMHGHGSQVPAQTCIPDGGKVVKPADPTETGWKFEGWYIDENYTQLYDFNTPVHENKVIHAKWTKIEWRVDFVMHGHGEQVPSQLHIPDGGKATDPHQGNDGEWIFLGWYIDENYTQLYDFNTPIHENKVLHAKWVKQAPAEYIVNISKTDVTKTKEIPGAKLTLSYENGAEIETWISGTAPHKVTLKAGKYTLNEKVAPEGYKLTNETIYFMIDSNGVLYEKAKSGTYVKVTKINMVNELLDVVSIIKKDQDTDKALANAVLVLRNANGDVVKEFTSTTQVAQFKLEAGNYSLVEKQAPNGYVKSETVVYFRLLKDGTLQVKNSKGEYVDSTVVTFYNKKKEEQEVPVDKTDLDSTVYIMGGLALLASGIYFANKTIKEY